MKQSESNFVCVPIPSAVFLEVATYLHEAQTLVTPSEFFCLAVEYLQQNIELKPDDLGHLLTPRSDGYQWKELFLPAGTQVRMKYKDAWYVAAIVENDFVYQGAKMSPSQFANNVTQSSRNAWRDLFIKRPGDAAWTLADTMRKR